MIHKKLHLVRAGRSTRPMTLKLVLAAALTMCGASQAYAQFDRGGYTSASTPLARAQQAEERQKRAAAEGIAGAVPSGPIPELQVFAAVSLAETYTSNGSGTVGNGRDDFYTQGAIHLGALEQSRRLLASLDYSLTGQYYARNHDLDQLIHQLKAMANAELLEQTLFLDVQASARPQALTRAGALTAIDGTPTNNNYRNTYSYAARPTLMHQFGNIAEADLWFSQSGIFFVRPSSANTAPLPGFFRQPNNSNTSALGIRIASLSDFTRLKWSVNASASDTYQTGHQSQKARSALANLAYRITSDFAVIGTGGYQTYHSSFLLTKDLDGPTLLGGFQFTPSPNFNFFVEAGTQNNFPTYIGSLTWNLTPLTAITAEATDRIETPQQSILGDLQNSSGMLGEGTPITPIDGTPGVGGEIAGAGLSIDNSIYRNRRLEARITHTLIRTAVSLGIYATIRDRLDAIPSAPFLNRRNEYYGVRLLASHNLRRDLKGHMGFSASRANEFNGHDRILEGSVGLSYSASPTLSLYTDTSVLNRESTGLVGFSNGTLTDVRVTVGVRKSF